MVEQAFRTSPARGVLLLLAIFLLGMVAGGAMFFLGQRSVAGPRHDRARQHGPPSGRLLDHLDLRPEQAAEIDRLMRQRHEQINRWIEESRQEIRGLLDPDQQKRFDEAHPRHDGVHRGRRFPPGHRPPPPVDP